MTDGIVIRGGYVLTMGNDSHKDGHMEVLIEDGIITAIEPHLPSTGRTIIDASGHIVMPGLIDSHRHLWYTPIRASTVDQTVGDIGRRLWPRVGPNITPDDVYHATRAGIVDALSGGITTVLDYCHVINSDRHADRALEAHLEMPGRVRFAYGTAKRSPSQALGSNGDPADWRHVESAIKVTQNAPRLSLALALQGPDASGRAEFERAMGLARDWGIPVTAHIAPADGGPPNREIASMAEWGLLGGDMLFSHCTGASYEQLLMMKQAGAKATVSPVAEWWMGLGTPAIARMHRAGLEPAVGADFVCSSTGDLFEEARAALMAARDAAAREVIASGVPVDTASQLGMTALDAVATITSRAADAVFMAEDIGSLEIGKRADVITVDDRGIGPETMTEAAGALIGAASASNVRTVIVDGVLVKRDGRLVGIDTELIGQGLKLTREAMRRYLA